MTSIHPAGHKSFREKYIGDKAFYKLVLSVALPIIIQSGITNFVSMLDNIMVGSLGTEEMSGVSVINQLYFVYMLCIFGGLGGIGIFTAQYFGKGDQEGIRKTFRVKLWMGIVLTIIAALVFWFFGDFLISLYLHEDGTGDLEKTLVFGRQYLNILLLSFPAFLMLQVYTSTLRECSETVLPMKAGIAAVVVNLVFNYLLIYGKFGFPMLGVAGAAIATVLSRFVELAYVVISCHRRHGEFRFIEGVYRSAKVPGHLVRRILVMGAPLLINEILWSLGMTFISRNYSLRGITVIAAANIATTVWNLFCVIMFAMGSAVSILVGQRLGAGDREGAIDIDRKLIFFTIVSNIAVAILMIAAAPVHAFIHAVYFTIRSGGKTVITFLFDSVYTWVCPAMLSLILCRFTKLDIVWIYFAVQFIDVVKLLIGVPLLRSGFWANNVIEDVKS